MIKQLLQQVNSLTSTVDSLNATINTQTQLIVQLNQTIYGLGSYGVVGKEVRKAILVKE